MPLIDTSPGGSKPTDRPRNHNYGVPDSGTQTDILSNLLLNDHHHEYFIEIKLYLFFLFEMNARAKFFSSMELKYASYY